MKQRDRTDGVLVDREHVIHVVLHLRDDTSEVGNEPPEDTGFVHPVQRNVGRCFRRQHLQEQAIGLRVVAQVVVDKLEALGHPAKRGGVDIQILRLGDVEQAQQVDWVLVENIVVGNVQPAALGDEIADLAPAGAEEQEPTGRPALLLRLQRGTEDTRQVADVLGD